jgi:hypothetical protein
MLMSTEFIIDVELRRGVNHPVGLFANT